MVMKCFLNAFTKVNEGKLCCECLNKNKIEVLKLSVLNVGFQILVLQIRFLTFRYLQDLGYSQEEMHAFTA